MKMGRAWSSERAQSGWMFLKSLMRRGSLFLEGRKSAVGVGGLTLVVSAPHVCTRPSSLFPSSIANWNPNIPAISSTTPLFQS